MTFDELKLAIAVHRADLGGADWTSHRQRYEAACVIYSEWVMYFRNTFFPFKLDVIERVRMQVRKNRDTRTKIEVAMAHGHDCYFSGRGKGRCSEDAECGHIIPRCRGGELGIENCQIECRAHNNQRREMSIEEYLASDLTT